MEDGTVELVLDEIIEFVKMKIGAMNPEIISCTRCDFLCGPYELEPILGVGFILDFHSRYPYNVGVTNHNRVHPEFVLVFSDFCSAYRHIRELKEDDPNSKKLIIIPTEDSKFPLRTIRVHTWMEPGNVDQQIDTCTIRMHPDDVTQFPELLINDGFVHVKDTVNPNFVRKEFSRVSDMDQGLVLAIIVDELSELNNPEVAEYINNALKSCTRESWNGKTLNTILMEYAEK
jgi:hypothetical protein